ncbi:hypothetical protein [Cereibacter changlensis]|uniref:hypothetical protein n=1 Tax=Cereibacter changlensis TaxID=402884 RepID=UPI00403331C1
MNFRDAANPDHTAFYVSAIDGKDRPRLAAGPYPTHAEALERLDAVRTHITDRDPVTWWWHWGTCSSPEPIALTLPLGAF